MSSSNIPKRKRVSKIPKLHPQHAESSFRTPSTSCESTVPKRMTSSRQIFDNNTLSNACEFLRQLKRKLEMEVGSARKFKKTEDNLNNLLATLMDVSDTLTPVMVNTRSASICTDLLQEPMISEREFNRTMEATSIIADFNRKPEQCYYVSQQITLNNMQSVNCNPCSDKGAAENKSVESKSAEKKCDDKLYIDKTLLSQLEQLHELLKDTINKLVDKETYTAEDCMCEGEGESDPVDDTIANTDAQPMSVATSPEQSEDEECMKLGAQSCYLNSDEEVK